MSLDPLGSTEEGVMMGFAEDLTVVAVPFAGGGALEVIAAGDMAGSID